MLKQVWQNGDLVLHLGDGRGQAQGVVLRQLQQVERDALGRLGPDARQAAELVDEVLDRTGVERHGRSVVGVGIGVGVGSVAEVSSTPPKPGRPPGTPPPAEAGHARRGRRGRWPPIDDRCMLVDLGDGVVEGGEHEVLEHGRRRRGRRPRG